MFTKCPREGRVSLIRKTVEFFHFNFFQFPFFFFAFFDETDVPIQSVLQNFVYRMSQKMIFLKFQFFSLITF